MGVAHWQRHVGDATGTAARRVRRLSGDEVYGVAHAPQQIVLGSAGGDLPVEVAVMCYVASPVMPSFGAMAFPAFFLTLNLADRSLEHSSHVPILCANRFIC